MLDVLGWQNGKSILLKEWHEASQGSLLGLKDMCQEYKKFENMRFVGFTIKTDIDNLIVAAWQPSQQIDVLLIEYISTWANALFSLCWQRKLPIRGCLSCGEFTLSEDHLTLSRPTVADVKKEYNGMNWAGCHVTTNSMPTLDPLIRKYKVLTRTFAGVEDPPYKDKSLTGMRWVISWPFAYYKQTNEKDIREIMANELKQVENEDIRKKYEITMRYFDKAFKAYEERDERQATKTSSLDAHTK